MRRRHLQMGWIVATCALVTAATCPSEIPERLPNGSWGGEHIGIVAADTGATIEYDCAAGVITQPLQLGPSGQFDWQGIHYPGHGGPIRIDEPPDAHAARYTGHATGDEMTITLTVLDASFAPQTFTLKRGGNARVFKCL